jgi:hypothetical protein
VREKELKSEKKIASRVRKPLGTVYSRAAGGTGSVRIEHRAAAAFTLYRNQRQP